VALAVVLVANLARSRAGRALQAVRDHDLAAEVIGVDVARYKIGAFAVAGAFAATAGALYGSLQQFVDPSQFGGIRGLFLSIQYIAVIVLGGIGTATGPVLGALLVGTLQFVLTEYSASIPLVRWHVGGSPFLSPEILDQLLYGMLIIGFLLVEPGGLNAAIQRAWSAGRRLVPSDRASQREGNR
jgi:branched-chain amino acid transport system permease protein